MNSPRPRMSEVNTPSAHMLAPMMPTRTMMPTTHNTMRLRHQRYSRSSSRDRPTCLPSLSHQLGDGVLYLLHAACVEYRHRSSACGRASYLLGKLQWHGPWRQYVFAPIAARENARNARR